MKTKGFSKTEGFNKKGQVALALEQALRRSKSLWCGGDSVAAA